MSFSITSPLKNIIITLIFGLGCIAVQAQKFTSIKSDFSILEKNTLQDSAFLVVGSLEYNLNSNYTIYKVDFPNKTTWEFRDSILTVYNDKDELEKTDTLGMMNDLVIFKKILRDELADFGLKEAGFSVIDVQQASSSVMMKWTPPPRMAFIKEVISKLDNNNLSGLIVIDENGKEINKTFYQDYVYVRGVPVPTKVKSHFIGDEEQIFKELQFRNVIIE